MEFVNEPDNTIKLDASNLGDLITFRQAFTFKPEIVEAVREKIKKEPKPEGEYTAADQLRLMFKYIPDFYNVERAKDWEATIHFKVDKADDYTLKVSDGKALTENGLTGDPTCVVTTNVFSLFGQLAFFRLKAPNLPDELTDDELEAVAGGKGGCGAEATGASACGGDACGGAACGGAACGGAACGGAACGGAACGGDACGGAVCGAAGCGGAACGADACGGAACGVAAGGAGACAAAACGIDVCPADACAADACGINAIPIIPGI